MKQQFTPKQKLNLTKKYNSSFRNYLNVLSLNNDQLDTFLHSSLTIILTLFIIGLRVMLFLNTIIQL